MSNNSTNKDGIEIINSDYFNQICYIDDSTNITVLISNHILSKAEFKKIICLVEKHRFIKVVIFSTNN